jgi:hypothetical protein
VGLHDAAQSARRETEPARSAGRQIVEKPMDNDLRVFDAILAVMACLLGVAAVMLLLVI